MDDQQQAIVSEVELTAPAETPGRRAVRLALRFGPVALVILVVAALAGSGALSHLSLDQLRASRGTLLHYVHAHPLLSLGAYFAVYVLSVALSLPAALVLTLTGGFLFGPWLGGAVASCASTLGATIVFAISRLTVGDALERRASPRVRAIEEGIKHDAFFYILTLRLIPVTPFWLVNVAAGLIAIRPMTFVIATLTGIIPVTVVYAGVGSGLGRAFDRGRAINLHTLVTPEIALPLAGLAVLSILPLIFQHTRNRRAAPRTSS